MRFLAFGLATILGLTATGHYVGFKGLLVPGQSWAGLPGFGIVPQLTLGVPPVWISVWSPNISISSLPWPEEVTTNITCAFTYSSKILPLTYLCVGPTVTLSFTAKPEAITTHTTLNAGVTAFAHVDITTYAWIQLGAELLPYGIAPFLGFGAKF